MRPEEAKKTQLEERRGSKMEENTAREGVRDGRMDRQTDRKTDRKTDRRTDGGRERLRDGERKEGR